MKLSKFLVLVFVLALIAGQVDGQKRRKNEKKKEEAPAGDAKRGGKTTRKPTTTTTTTTTTTPEPEEEIDPDEEVGPARVEGNECPPELKHGQNHQHPCTCRDQLEDEALMVECTGLTSAEQMHEIFHTYLLGKRVDAIDVHKSNLGALVGHATAQTYTGMVFMRRNRITDLHPDAFQGTDRNVGRLDLSSNELTRVNFSIFDSYKQLQVLNLGENQLTSIRDGGRAPALRVLLLYSNQIDSIAPQAFYHLQALEYLDLRFNNLQTLAPSSLELRSNRWQLRIRSNQISTLEDAFGQSPFPYVIDINSNNLSHLKDYVYGPIIEMALLEGTKIYMKGNPIVCDCTLAWLIKNATLLQVVDGARCDGDGIPIADVDSSELRHCPKPQTWISPLARINLEAEREVIEDNSDSV